MSAALFALTLALFGIITAAIESDTSILNAGTCNFRDCSSCTSTTRTISSDCRWCGNICVSRALANVTCGENKIYRFDDSCPAVHPSSTSALTDWMGNTMDAIGQLTLLDISLPGTHDTLTNDLDLIVSDGGADDLLTFARILHDYANIVPDAIEDFIRQQAQTQDLDITQQLNAGMRFIDFRMIYEYSDKNPEWYSLHFMQSVEPAINYFKDIRVWLDAHPSEVVVLWLSKHGNENAVGEEQYPNTTVAQKQAFWGRITDVFDGLLVDFRETQLNVTTLSDMVSRGHRVVIYAADYEELTNNSPFAQSSQLIDNESGPNVDDEPSAIAYERQVFAAAPSRVTAGKASNRFYLLSLATGVPAETTALAAAIRFLPANDTTNAELNLKCASYFHLEGMNWCPQTLLDIAQLENYYKQITLEEALETPGWGYPHAIYINAVDAQGTIRTGSQVLWGAERSTNADISSKFGQAKYSYADSIILHNIRLGCNNAEIKNTLNCAKLEKQYQARRELNPVQRWSDPALGRLENWP